MRSCYVVLAHYSVITPYIFCSLSCKNWKFQPPPKSANTFLRGQKNLAKMILFVVTHKILMCALCMYFLKHTTWKNIGDWKSLHLFPMVCSMLSQHKTTLLFMWDQMIQQQGWQFSCKECTNTLDKVYQSFLMDSSILKKMHLFSRTKCNR